MHVPGTRGSDGSWPEENQRRDVLAVRLQRPERIKSTRSDSNRAKLQWQEFPAGQDGLELAEEVRGVRAGPAAVELQRLSDACGFRKRTGLQTGGLCGPCHTSGVRRGRSGGARCRESREHLLRFLQGNRSQEER